MKKVLSLLIVLSLVLSLTACGSGGSGTEDKNTSEPSGDESATESAEEEDASEPSEDVEASEPAGDDSNTLSVWCWDPTFNIAAMETAAEIYKRDNPDFVLDVVEVPWGDLQTKLTTAATSGDLSTLPDIILMQDNAFQKNVMSFPEVFTELTGSGVNFSDFGEAKVAYSVVDGKNYGLPFDNGASVGCYRIDVLEAAGLTLDDVTDITWSEFIEKGKKVLEATGKPMLSAIAGESELISIMLQSAGASMFNEDGTASLVNNDTLQEVMEVYQELVDAGILMLVNDWNGYSESITKGNVVGTINGCWILGTIQTMEDESGNWGVTNMPKLEKSAGATNYSSNGGSSWAVTANCQNTDLAFDFLAKTFAGSVELYETILPSSGALATYLPAGDSDVYSEPQEFFGGDAVYAKITEYAGKVPSNITGVYYYEARDAVAVAATNVVNGADIVTELQNAEDTVNFNMDN